MGYGSAFSLFPTLHLPPAPPSPPPRPISRYHLAHDFPDAVLELAAPAGSEYQCSLSRAAGPDEMAQSSLRPRGGHLELSGESDYVGAELQVPGTRGLDKVLISLNLQQRVRSRNPFFVDGAGANVGRTCIFDCIFFVDAEFVFRVCM